ncbi:hypothetical protein KIN20_029417 [Parelaphostrongylus tenuis]|uniref:Uncharacterized protein n=1 Tax=Parelaphostrongylus tenuis TaxID=148309 RepID=A0AAD5R2D2_PARTN|nr:hypothetical protein KIN20_029417 [Parelaphostrongylus tenuis]
MAMTFHKCSLLAAGEFREVGIGSHARSNEHRNHLARPPHASKAPDFVDLATESLECFPD